MTIPINHYIQIQAWMITALKLKGSELLTYALIYGFSFKEDCYFRGSASYIGAWLNLDTRQVYRILKSLTDKGLIFKIEKDINNVKLCDYEVNRSLIETLFNSIDEMSYPMTKCQGGTDKMSYHNNRDNNKEDNNKDNIHNNLFFSSLNSSSSKADLLYNSDIQNFFNLYSELCANLIPLGYEKRNLDFCAVVFDFLTEIENNQEYLKNLFIKANDLKFIFENKIDVKAIIKNHARISSGYYEPKKEVIAQEILDSSKANLQDENKITNYETFISIFSDFLEQTDINSPYEYKQRLNETLTNFDAELVNYKKLYQELSERILNSGKGERTLLNSKEFMKIISACYDWQKQNYFNQVLNCKIQQTADTPLETYSIQRKELKGLTLEEYKNKMLTRVYKFEWV